MRIEGRAERTSDDESDAHHRGRPRASRLAAWASRRANLSPTGRADAAYAERERDFKDGDVPFPPFWGGIRVVPDAYEFWQHRANRLHDRFRYLPEGEGWRIERLGP